MTIKDIAEKCGVSVATVSRVINDQPYVKQEVRNLVMRVIEEEHFVPHEGAAALARGDRLADGRRDLSRRVGDLRHDQPPGDRLPRPRARLLSFGDRLFRAGRGGFLIFFSILFAFSRRLW